MIYPEKKVIAQWNEEKGDLRKKKTSKWLIR